MGPYREPPKEMKIDISFHTKEVAEALYDFMVKKKMHPLPTISESKIGYYKFIDEIRWEKINKDSIAGWDHIKISFTVKE